MAVNLSRARAALVPVFLASSFFCSQTVLACACGCGFFDVGTNGMFPTTTGGSAFIEYDYLDQNQNRSQGSAAPASANPDKEIRTQFIQVGGRYVFNRDWGIQAEVPYWSRFFSTTDDSGNLQGVNHGALGDIRLKATYTGFSEGMSTGISFGLKLPTGDSSFAGLDPDTEIGSGSTDLLLGVYHLFQISTQGDWNGFFQVNLDQPILSNAVYLPGNEIDGAVGAYYGGWNLGSGVQLSPLLAALFVFRGADSGSAADPIDSGYRRMLIAPGLEVNAGSYRFDAEVQLPVAQYYNGNQLVAPVSYKLAAMVLF